MPFVLVGAVLAHPASAFGAAPGAPTYLITNSAVNPVGTDAAPEFGWRVNDADLNEVQTQYEILVASSQALLNANTADKWASGVVTSGRQNFVPYAGALLTSNTKYFWKVRTYDKNFQVGPWSATATFVVGLLTNADWSPAKWIRRVSADADDYTYHRKSVSLPAKTVARATLFISGTHKYEAYLNGTLVGKGPSYHHPQYQYYNAYDVSSLVTAGASNVLAVLNHWFGGGQGRPAADRGIIAKLVVSYTDGTSTVVGSDASWKTTRATQWVTGQPKRNGEGVGYIERIDAAQIISNWNSTGYSDVSWAAATEVGAQPVSVWSGNLNPDLTRIVETEVSPASVISKGGGKYVIDLGKVRAGVPKITFSGGTPGTVVTMRGGFKLTAAGEIDTAPLANQATDMKYYAVTNGATFIFQPLEYLGMRYFQVDNSPSVLNSTNVKLISRHLQLDGTASSFTSSSTTLNAVYDLMKNSLYLGAQEQFVDTPTREKGAFLLDSAWQSTATMPIFGERLLTRKAIKEFLTSMNHHWSASPGRMNAVYPNNDGARDIPDFTQAFMVWFWEYYMTTGDKKLLTDSYGKLKQLADYVHAHRNATTGLIHRLTGGSGAYLYGIIDWPSSMRFGYDMSDAQTVVNAYAYAVYDVVAKAASVVGNSTDQATYRARADAVKTAMNTRLLNASNVYVDGLSSTYVMSGHAGQQANVMPLALGMVPPAQQGSVVNHVKDLKVSLGMVTVKWLTQALGEADEGEHLIDVYTDDSWPQNWAVMKNRGATATWESWNSDTSATQESLSHGWGAVGLEAIVKYVLGIKPLAAQYSKVQIKPLAFGNRLSDASGHVATDRGPIAVSWETVPGQFLMTATLPVNTSARVCVPMAGVGGSVVRVDGVDVNGVAESDSLCVDNVGSGTHSFARATGASYKYDVGNGPLAAGYTQVTSTSAYSTATGHGWASTTGLDQRNRGGPDELRGDFVFSKSTNTFKQDLANGTYNVRVLIGDQTAAQVAMDVKAEGVVKLDDVSTVSPGAFIDRTFSVTVADGQLSLEFVGVAGDFTARINAIEIWP